jgi:hypothetical protein
MKIRCRVFLFSYKRAGQRCESPAGINNDDQKRIFSLLTEKQAEEAAPVFIGLMNKKGKGEQKPFSDCP